MELAETSINTERFNKEAADWDNDPYIQKMSDMAWQALQSNVAVLCQTAGSQHLDFLEFGCGTGLLTLLAAPSVRRIVAVDAAQGMVDVLRAKLDKAIAPRNVTPLTLLLEDPEDKRLPAENSASQCGTSHLVLHHIPDLTSVLKTMLGCLKSGGQVATDFEDFGPEARRFHPESKMSGVQRHGIERDWMARLIEEVGFVDVTIQVAWRHEKLVEEYPGQFDAGNEKAIGEPMEFSYLLCMGKKP